MILSNGGKNRRFWEDIMKKLLLAGAMALGSMAMAGGSMHSPFFCVSWPSGEFGGMGLEGAIRLGYKKELERIS